MLKLNLVLFLLLPSISFPLHYVRYAQGMTSRSGQVRVPPLSPKTIKRMREVPLGTTLQDQAAADDKCMRRFYIPKLEDALVTAYVALHAQGNRSLVLGYYRDSDTVVIRQNLAALADSVLRNSAANPITHTALIMVLPGRYVVDPRDRDNLVAEISDDSRELIDQLSDTAATTPYVTLYDAEKHVDEVRDDFQLNFNGPVCMWNARSDGYVIRTLAQADER